MSQRWEYKFIDQEEVNKHFEGSWQEALSRWGEERYRLVPAQFQAIFKSGTQLPFIVMEREKKEDDKEDVEVIWEDQSDER